MGFTIQYFARRDRLICAECVDGDELDEALERARVVLRSTEGQQTDTDLDGYVILNSDGRLVARGYIGSRVAK